MPKVKKDKGTNDYGKQGNLSKYLYKFLFYDLPLFC